MMDDVFAEFSYRVDELQDYPNRDLIVRLTQLALENVMMSEKLGNVVMAKLIHPQTLSTYKKPLFYVVDSILKKVGGPFPAYFENALAEHFPRTVQDINEDDRRKLDFLFGTWEERQVLSLGLLAKMRHLLKQQPSFSRQPAQLQQYQPIQNMPAAVRRLPMMNKPDQNSDIYKDLIANEMVSVLNSVLAEMRMTNPMTLEELSIMNPALFAQIRSKAEQNAAAIMHQRMMQQQHQQSSMHAQQQYPYFLPSSAGMNGFGIVNGVGGYLPQQRVMSQQQQLQQQQAIPSSQQPHVSQQFQPRPRQSGGPVILQNANKRPIADIYSQPQQTVDQYPPSLAINVPHTSIVNANQGNAQPVEYVNGFMCETPAIISVNRLQTLSHHLSNLSDSTHAQFSPPFRMVSGRLSQRLQDYIPLLMQPPSLPDIFTDGRFLSNNSSTGVQQQVPQNSLTIAPAAGGHGNGTMRFQPPPPPIMPKPEFKLADFDKQPELKSRALRNLYDGRPHQCYEDGLRFTNLQQLRQHTDSILERKKLLKKKSDRKEPQNREWFCTLPQWITNFQSMVLGATSADAITSGQSGGYGSGIAAASAVVGEAAEEFVIPADENFTRCPVSAEVFQTSWDDEEGEMMYRNAVKVLLPPGSEPNLYHMARPVDGVGASTGIKYMIVHKLLVVDKWLQERKAVPLSDFPTNELITQQLKEAAGEEDAEDIFVLLNQSLRF